MRGQVFFNQRLPEKTCLKVQAEDHQARNGLWLLRCCAALLAITIRGSNLWPIYFNRFVFATSSLPTASLFLPCASIRASMDLPTSGTWSIWAAAQSAGLRQYWLKLLVLPLRAESVLKIWAYGATPTSSRCIVYFRLSRARDRFLVFSSLMPDARPAPASPGRAASR